ncbi:Lipopolysaccharide core heptosyltransferase RfaQ [Vibrio thalassae]|uniref:Lipopolysaccharide core heptosyltransferase RfaQ n=1 Tax=Vibrio thalassae TaxID=1243014 RepID=A0A240EGK5_9VIBR|nr:glycosyltransferase family 9 protein [Vibrio thalassae]SNX47828.1 Lipopolysaccharide core heptosyltransferase RfaQ [Vibrio thalassae]
MKNILVVRNDKIGDFMLAWPSFAMLKASLPECRITALVPNYTVALAKACPWIDEVIVDCGEEASKRAQATLVNTLKGAKFDASINLFSTTYNALLVWKAKIPYRLAPATKLAQIFYNKRIKQKRSQSAKPEFEYNLDLIRAFLRDQNIDIIEPHAPYFSFSLDALAKQKEKLSTDLDLNKGLPWIYVHAGSGGSANNLSLEQYCELICGIELNAEIVLTAGPGEEKKARQLQQLLAENTIRSVVYEKNDGLVDFSCSLACASLFIAGSTGPLHIAAALDVPTVGFFPAKRSATPLRWQPINSEGRHLPFYPPHATDTGAQEDMSRIDVVALLPEINRWIHQGL